MFTISNVHESSFFILQRDEMVKVKGDLKNVPYKYRYS